MDEFPEEAETEKICALVATLNQLLRQLHIPIPVDSPVDLTPSLLLAILESILRSRLPISPSVRASRDIQSKIQAMKIFLGVLEGDVLGEDVGLSDVDPRKLASGEWDEVVFVGELLCWLGKKSGVLPIAPDSISPVESDGEEDPQESVDVVRVRASSPSTHSTVTTRNSINSALSMTRDAPPESDTTVQSIHPESSVLSELDLFETASHTNSTPVMRPSRLRPRCIHETEDPSFVRSSYYSRPLDRAHTGVRPGETPSLTSFCDCTRLSNTSTTFPKKTKAPVRHTGWIQEVDDELEMEAFKAGLESRRDDFTCTPPASTPRVRYPALYATPRAPSHTGVTPRILTRHNSPTEHTLALLHERAKLMAELANVTER